MGDCTSLCDEEDDSMDNLVSLSFVNHDDDSDGSTDTPCVPPPKDDGSISSDNSLSLEDLSTEDCDEDHDDDVGLNVLEEIPQDDGDDEVNSMVEVELVEDDENCPHRIHCSDATPLSQRNRLRRRFRRSWSHPEWKPPLSCASMTPQQQLLEAPPTSSSLDLGSLFLGAVTGIDWWK